ncbi:MAG: alpha-amylase [Desulfobacterium sp.]|nr:alpha-amylase [Desulfobacterium sp.]MBU4009373.1 alpha-amylase [Pseudomonadota bacterium]MBU4036395.1 alpha-amylase [Pseudomonadota bacterium]
MDNIKTILSAKAPGNLTEALANWPVREKYNISPSDWRDQVFYFLLPDRFSNGKERPKKLLDADLSTDAGLARIHALRGKEWCWDKWQNSGANRFQGGTLAGVHSKLDYLKNLGITTLWIGPVFRQRIELNTYHGYGVQDFLDIDPRFGSRRDLIDLVNAAHDRNMYVVLDIIFNHSGCNWLYDTSSGDIFQPGYLPPFGSYSPIWPRNGFGSAIMDTEQALGRDDYVWPVDLQGLRHYLRTGSGDLGKGDIDDDNAEHKRTDFCDLRKFDLFSNDTLGFLILVYQYWLALTDIDGYRIDTFKHVTFEQARNFCNALKEYAEDIDKDDLFLVAEVAGGNSPQDQYLDVTGRNLNSCLDIGEQREILCNTGKGIEASARFFAGFNYYDKGMGSHRNWGSRHLSVANDHDHVFGSKLRLAVDASNDRQGAAVTAVQLFTLGIPCIYYGTEQGLAGGAEPDQRKYLNGWGSNDCLLREAMFGPLHPRASGFAGTLGKTDRALPGFGPHGTCGWHVFNTKHPAYARIAMLSEIRKAFKPLRRGRQYQRQISFFGNKFAFCGAGEIIAWSRIFDDQEMLVVINPHGTQRRGGRVLVDGHLSAEGMQIVANTDPAAPEQMKAGAIVNVDSLNGYMFVSLDKWLLGPSETMVLANRRAIEAAALSWNI